MGVFRAPVSTARVHRPSARLVYTNRTHGRTRHLLAAREHYLYSQAVLTGARNTLPVITAPKHRPCSRTLKRCLVHPPCLRPMYRAVNTARVHRRRSRAVITGSVFRVPVSTSRVHGPCFEMPFGCGLGWAEESMCYVGAHWKSLFHQNENLVANQHWRNLTNTT